jgi:hypothetical protein
MPPEEPDAQRRYGTGDAPLVLPPQIPWDRYLLFGILMGCFIPLIGIGAYIIFSPDPVRIPVVIGSVAVLEAGLLAGGVNLYMVGRISRLVVDADSLIFVTRLGIRRAFPRAVLKQIVRRSFDLTVRGSYTLSYFVVVGVNGRALVKLPQKWWPEEGIQAVGRALPLPVTGSFLELVDGPTFRREYPGSIPWVVAHPRLAAVLAGLLFLPAIAAVLLLYAVMLSLLRWLGVPIPP